MGYIRIKRSQAVAVPENALLFYDAGTGDYYFLTDELSNYLTWETV